jgi:MerR family transcriptional regulator/heat shock protein HspR
MNPPILPRSLVAEQLCVSTRLLRRLEERGLVQPVRHGECEGYGPAEVRRIWTIVSLRRDLGINLAGIEAILRLHAHLAELHRRVRQLAEELEDALDQEPDLASDDEP